MITNTRSTGGHRPFFHALVNLADISVNSSLVASLIVPMEKIQMKTLNLHLKLLGYHLFCLMLKHSKHDMTEILLLILRHSSIATYLAPFGAVLAQPTVSHVSCNGLPTASHGWGLSPSLWVLLRLGNYGC